MPKKANMPRSRTVKKVPRTKKPLIKRIKFGRLLLVLILLSGIVYGAFIVLTGIYDWGSFKYAQYQSNNPPKPTIAPQVADKRFENYTNILLIGIDDQPKPGVEESGRYADAVMLVSMNHTTGQIQFLSLPRNIKIDIPGRKEPDFLSFTYYYGGSLLTVDSVSQLLNIPITQYIALDRKALSKFVDALGGINIYVEDDMNYEDPAGNTSIHLSKGYQHLTGDMAQQYLRYRSDDLGDIGRVQRQQRFAKALLDKMLTFEAIPTIPSIVTIFNDNMDTNVRLTDISSLIDLFDTIRSKEVTIRILPGNLSSTGEWIPDTARISHDIDEMFPPLPEESAESSKS